MTASSVVRACLAACLLPFLLGLPFAPSAAAAEGPRIVVSLAPLHALVSTLLGERGEARLLLRGGVSPHRYALRPSDALAMQRADLVVWVGPGLENFLERALGAGGGGARVLTLAEVPGLIRWPLRSGGLWHASAPADEHDEHEAHPSGGVDPHFWLDPRNAATWLRAIHAELVRIDPSASADYARRLAYNLRRLDQLDLYLATRLGPVSTRPYLVFHDAYQYLERRYSLNATGSVAVASGRPPGAGRILQIRDRLQRNAAVCLFTEPQFEPRLASRLVEDSNVRLGLLDPLGSAIEPGPEHYFTLMRGLADALVDCLATREPAPASEAAPARP